MDQHLPFSSNPKRQLIGSLLVFLQFGLLLLLTALAMPKLLQGAISITSGLLAALSVTLAGWTFAHNRLGNFNIRPTPKTNGVLVTSGPYRHIRHPMYSAVLLGAAALAGLSEPLPGTLAWITLALVLGVKAALEERWMRDYHPQYSAYCRHSKRFLPWLF